MGGREGLREGKRQRDRDRQRQRQTSLTLFNPKTVSNYDEEREEYVLGSHLNLHKELDLQRGICVLCLKMVYDKNIYIYNLFLLKVLVDGMESNTWLNLCIVVYISLCIPFFLAIYVPPWHSRNPSPVH